MISKRGGKADLERLDKIAARNVVLHDSATSHRYAQAFDCSLKKRVEPVTGYLGRELEVRNSRLVQPDRPVITKDQRRSCANDRMAREVARFAQPLIFFQEEGRANREYFFSAYLVSDRVRPVP